MTWYLDLDDTLYRTTYGYEQMCRAVSQLYGIRTLTFALRLLRLRQKTPVGSRRGYLRYFYTLRSFGIDGVEAEALIYKHLHGRNFLYDDAIKLLDWLEQQGIEPVILTFGDTETQEFKMSLIPRLERFKKVVVQQPKQEYLKNLSKHDAILVDDKPVDDLPTWCQGVLIARGPVKLLFAGKTITSLTELINE